jgi:hypothetical protein
MAPPPVEDTSLLTQISEASKYAYARRRPWSELFSTASFSRPRSLAEATDRVRRHLVYFRINYAFILLALVLCSLLREPFSLIVVLAVAVAWYALYFFRSEPLVILNQSFGDGAVLAGLTVATALALLLTGVAGTILTAVAVGFAIVVLHGALRASDDLFLDEEEATRGGVISSAGYNSLPANNSGRSF